MLSIISLLISSGALFLTYSCLQDIERRIDFNQDQIERLREVTEGIVKYLKSDLNNEPPPA